MNVETGLVAYGLVQMDWADANCNHWDRLNCAVSLHWSDGTQELGTVPMQLLDNRRLQVEVFVGKRASQVKGFTNAESFMSDEPGPGGHRRAPTT